MEAAGTCTWSAAALPESVAFLRRAVSDFADRAGVLDPPLGNVRLAVSEAVTNAVIHAYRHDPDVGSVDVAATLGDEVLHVVVADRGAGFAARNDSPGAGFGLRLMKEMADGIEIRPVEPRGTAVHLSFKVADRIRLVSG